MTRTVLIHPRADRKEEGIVTSVTAQQAGWEFLNLEVRSLSRGARWAHNTCGNEMVIVVLGGTCSVTSNRRDWDSVGRRADVFSGMPYALYLPPGTQFVLTGMSDGACEFAACWTASDQEHPAQLVRPEHSQIEIRGGHNATRQVNSIVPPGFDCHKLVAVEVYTPGGNWSSYPPHKHDEHRVDADGKLIEGDLEEIYFYKFRRQNAFAVQRVYTADASLNETLVARNNDIVLVPEGYHPVSAAYGYDCYYLNFLAGSAQTLACTFDPHHAWTMDTWGDNKDPRLPLVTHDMERAAVKVAK
jgi:5-deoxy-glucuronate isomerase